jgi:hypothetical protein
MPDDKKVLTLGERAANWAKALALIIPVMGASIAGAVGFLKGDDAQKNIDSLIDQLSSRVAKQERAINAQSEAVEKMARRMIFFQGHQAGVSAGKLFFKLEATEQSLNTCLASQAKRGRVKKGELEDMIGAAMKRSRPRIKASGGVAKPQGIQRLEPRPFRKAK